MRWKIVGTGVGLDLLFTEANGGKTGGEKMEEIFLIKKPYNTCC